MSLSYQQFRDRTGDVLIRYQREVDRLRGEVEHYRQIATNAQLQPQEQGFQPAPGDPGFSPDGNHDLQAWRDYQARQEREPREIRRRQEFRANIERDGRGYEWEPMPGDANFQWR